MILLVSTFAVVLGAFVAASPAQAAKIWGPQKLDSMTPGQRVSFLRWYRAFGILLCLGGVLFAVDNLAFSC